MTPHEQLLLYMRGWKAAAAARAKDDAIAAKFPIYVSGYEDGAIARLQATEKARQGLGVTAEEIMLGVLR